MSKANALKIFCDLSNEEYTVGDKIAAIVEVSQMPTHNSVKKADMVNAIRFMSEVLAAVLED